ncbi:SR-related and CTD-associated factor 4-like [Thalassophryne amazonica]|uniref:SR-related and CTD-associated factor 4-like n=1 Tax=Thalassophryne amazonica TaxID=390379 RepID=UPI0014726457|nr:SR-related and CTD-associated factor 4-like [Thalassophryne amazonica]
MEAVNAFNMEMFSMTEMKPPISRAKMMCVTKAAIKAIKLYKHVVQIVEKFIKKCKPELKVPGLYVVDSIVRQSRHQFGVDRDVFGPRFLKNFTDTFQNLYCCPEDDKSKIVRVLNLWQKNDVFGMDTIQPLMDMANGVIVPHPTLEGPPDPPPDLQPATSSATFVTASPQLLTPDTIAAVAQLLQSSSGQELQKMLQNFQQGDKTLVDAIASNKADSCQMPIAQENAHAMHTEKKNALAQNLLDRFDYDDEPEDPTNKDCPQLQGVPENILMHFPGQMPCTQPVDPHIKEETGGTEPGLGVKHGESDRMQDKNSSTQEVHSHLKGHSREDLLIRKEDAHKSYGRRARSKSRSRSPRRRSRSTSRSRRSRHQSSQFRERRVRSRSRSEDRVQREKDRQRRQQGLPRMKSQTLSVCSTTLWVGQLDKRTQQSDVMSLLEEFGQIESVNMIPPRGCAYIVMTHRQDAYTAMNKLGRGSYKVNQKPVKIAWALNKGIKAVHKKFWDIEQGVTYIPWSKVKVEDLESFCEGGILDADTLSPEWSSFKNLTTVMTVNGVLESTSAHGAVAAHIQVPQLPQTAPIGSPPTLTPPPIMLSPTSVPAAPFIAPEFDRTLLQQAGTGMLTESTNDLKEAQITCLDVNSNSHLGSSAVPVMNLPGPTAMQGPRLGVPPLQHPPAMPNLPTFVSPPNMSHVPLPTMPTRPMFSPDRFRVRMPLLPHGPPYIRSHPMGPGGVDGRGGRPGFGYTPFHRGRW